MTSETLEEFLRRLGDATPTPGGGSAAAYGGAMAAALAGMVANLALGKEGYEGVQLEAREVVLKSQALQRRLLELVTLDADAYESVMLCYKMPKANDEERRKRKDAIQHALKHATLVPLETMERAVETLEIALIAAEKGNRSAFTDAGASGFLAQACVRAAALNVRINLASIADSKFRDESDQKMQSLIGRSEILADRVSNSVNARM